MSHAAQKVPDFAPVGDDVKAAPSGGRAVERRAVLSCEVGHLLAALRRVQVPINKDGANIAFISGDAATARLVATSGPHLSCSTALGMAIPDSFVVKGPAMLKTLATYGPEGLEASLQLGLAASEGVDQFCDLQVRNPGRYRGTLALVPDAIELNMEAIQRERECRRDGTMVRISQKPFFAGMRRAVMCAKNKTNNANYSNVFFESDGERLWVIGVSATYASRVCIAASDLPQGRWSVSGMQADLVTQGVGDQVIDEDTPIEVAFASSQILFSIGHVTYALRCTQGQLPALERIVAPFKETWSVNLAAEDVKQVLHLLPIMASDDAGRQGLRFVAEDGMVMGVPEGKNTMEAQIPLGGALMKGSMPGGIFLASAILGSALRADPEMETVTLKGADGSNHHIHVIAPGIEGLMVIMPTSI